MPWTIVKQDDEWCVYKHDADGNPVGDSLGCHATEAEAHEQMRALSAKMGTHVSEIICEMVWEFRGDYPDVPFASGVDVEAFKADTDPMFVTLPVAKVGVKSRNGRPFALKDVQRIVQQINSKRPEGILGHVASDKRGTYYELPKLRWVGATLEGDLAWAKAWVPRYAADVREFFRDAKRAGARVGTSIYGTEGEQGLADMDLESIDLGHPDRLGVPDLGVVPRITLEMNGESVADPIETEKHGKDGEGEPAETSVVETPAVETPPVVTPVIEMEGIVEDVDRLVAELRSERDSAQTALEQHKTLVAELSALVPGSDLLASVRVMVAEVADLRKKVLTAEIAEAITSEVKLADLRPIIAEMMGPVGSKEAALVRVRELLQSAHIQRLAKALVLELGGPRTVVSMQGLAAKFEDTPEKRAAARAEFGF